MQANPLRCVRLSGFLHIIMTGSSQIPFDPWCADQNSSQILFWDSKRSWFLERGYALYQICYHPSSKTPIPYCLTPTFEPNVNDVALLYAHFGGDMSLDSNAPALAADIRVCIHSTTYRADVQDPYSPEYCMHKTSGNEVWS